MSLEKPVRALNAEVARKIAAGEVIDRPNAIIRELMDNAIDSGANSITVEIAAGGIEKIRIIDNGCGMTKEDLQNCARPHSTSKISTETDLMNLSTLGFRGEALASIAAVARLSILSGGWKMRASITEDHIIEPATEIQGTIVMAEGIFENFPARRQFLKRAATEGVMCRNTFIEKAVAHPDIAFRFICDGETKIDLPAASSFKDRFVAANQYSESKDLFFELTGKSENSVNEIPDWSFTAVIGEPAVSRNNKKEIYIYANGRRIQEYSLVQAVEYGGQGFFPNGTYPVAALFIQARPDTVDFNIHPAKREARFYDISDLHHGVSSTIKAFFKTYTFSNFTEDKNTDSERKFDFQYEKHISYKAPETGEKYFSDFRTRYLGGGSGNSSGTTASSFSSTGASVTRLAVEAANVSSSGKADFSKNTSHISESTSSTLTPAENYLSNRSIRFIGSALGTFLLVEKNNCLYMIDQHAVHERILFDRLMNSQGQRQKLLIPYKIQTESKSQDNQLEKLQEQMIKIGFDLQKISPGNWEINSVPERWTLSEYDLRTLLFVKHVEPVEIIRSIAAMTACKAAVKDGYILDDDAAEKLAIQAFDLEDPHCPHGRPVYTVISREKLFELVKRT